jgi:GntR family transcriptional regulator, phosphonate transport system regulatory protein
LVASKIAVKHTEQGLSKANLVAQANNPRRNPEPPTCRLLQVSEAPADVVVAAELAIPAGSPIAELRNLILGDDAPIGFGRHLFPGLRLPGILPALRMSESISEALERVGIVRRILRRLRITARLCGDEMTCLLDCSRYQALLECDAVYANPGGQAIEFLRTCFIASHVEIALEA